MKDYRIDFSGLIAFVAEHPICGRETHDAVSALLLAPFYSRVRERVCVANGQDVWERLKRHHPFISFPVDRIHNVICYEFQGNEWQNTDVEVELENTSFSTREAVTTSDVGVVEVDLAGLEIFLEPQQSGDVRIKRSFCEGTDGVDDRGVIDLHQDGLGAGGVATSWRSVGPRRDSLMASRFVIRGGKLRGRRRTKVNPYFRYETSGPNSPEQFYYKTRVRSKMRLEDDEGELSLVDFALGERVRFKFNRGADVPFSVSNYCALDLTAEKGPDVMAFYDLCTQPLLQNERAFPHADETGAGGDFCPPAHMAENP